MHRLLKRQLKRHFDKDFRVESLDPKLQDFMETISQTYYENDRERRFIENTVELNSKELNDAHALIEEKNKNLHKLLNERSKLLENRIEENEEISATLKQYKQAMDSVLLINTFDLNNIITFSNEKLCQITQFNMEELIGKKVDILYNFNTNKTLYEHILKQSHETFIGQVVCLNKNREVFYVNIVIFPLHEKDGTIKEYMSILQDITQIEKSRQKAQELEKTKSEFLASMSHELRTPLNAIIGFSTLLKRNNTLSDKLKVYVEKINISGENLLNLINSILDFSKLEAGRTTLEKKEFNLQNITKNALNQIELRAKEKKLHLQVHYSKDCAQKFLGDSLRISQILINLLSNAIKFTEHGEVLLNITRVHKNRYLFEVKDSGIGLTQEQKEKLFNPFMQADTSTTRKYGGTGLGLVISKQLIEMMNGTIWVESEAGVGSSFFFEISLQELEECTQELSHKSTILNNLNVIGTKQILLVDDNTTNRFLILSLLEETNIIIDIAHDGKEAVEKVENNNYDLILMDIEMPIMNGYESTAIIRKKNKEIPIIALSANALSDDMRKSSIIGMNEHLSKPIEIEKLHEVLLKYLT